MYLLHCCVCLSATEGAWVHLNISREDGWRVYQNHAEHWSPLTRWELFVIVAIIILDVKVNSGVLEKYFQLFLVLIFSTLSPEYVDNLKDEGRVCGIIDRLLTYMENKGSTEEICRIYLRRIMHTYYKFDYKAHRRSLGLQGESKVRKPQEWYSLREKDT